MYCVVEVLIHFPGHFKRKEFKNYITLKHLQVHVIIAKQEKFYE